MCALLSGSNVVQAQSSTRTVPQSPVINIGDAVAPTYQPITAMPAQSVPPVVQGAPAAAESYIVEQAPQATQYASMMESTAACACNECAGAPAPAAKKKDKPTCAKSHKGLFYANDFGYLSNPDYSGNCLGDSLKGIGSGNKLDIGGQFRLRYHSETGMGQQAGFTRFQNTQNDFLLGRLRLYANYSATDRLRFFVEGIYADVITQNDEYIPRGPIDRNRGDFLNAFVDVGLNDNITVRVGRQELLYGAQRFVSPLDWSNTRRTFDGVRTLMKYDNVNIDMWYTQQAPVLFDELDRPNEDVNFYGFYATFTGLENKTLDVYSLNVDNETGPNGTEHVNTFGSRLQGKTVNKLLYEVEGAFQTGTRRDTGQNIAAYAWTAGFGYQFENVRWKPTLWFFYDYATGNEPGSGDWNRFNDLFPLGHKYLGFIDAVQRRNIQSPNVRMTMAPTKKLNLLLWYHNFQAEEPTDTILSLGGTPGQDPTSSDFGNELDFTASYKLSPRSSVLAGYSHLWRGTRILGDTDADFFYLQWQTNF